MSSPTTTVRNRLAEATGTQAHDWHLFFKARYGMVEVFNALALDASTEGGALSGRHEIVTQALTCATAVDPILVAGLVPVYGEIDAHSLSLDPEPLPVRDTTAAVVIQHSFGIIDEQRARRVSERAREAGALVIEDSAHGATRLARNEHGEPLADVSIHSFGVEKMLPTSFGGAVWVNPHMPASPRSALTDALAHLPAPPWQKAFAARTYLFQRRALARIPGGARLRHSLSQSGWFEPAIMPVETQGGLALPSYGISDWIAGSVADALASVADIQAQRSAASAVYSEALADLTPDAARAAQPLIRHPLLVPPGVSPDAVSALLDKQGIFAGKWYRPALFPGVADPAVYHYQPGALPVTQDVIDRIVNLPTNVTLERARHIARATVAAIDSLRDART